MTTTLTATFDGKALIPAGELDLPKNAVVRLRVESVDVASDSPKSGSIWEKLRRLAGTVEGPPDWARNHDHYIHGAPKRP